MHPGEGRRQLDQPQGGRGAVPRAGANHPALRRRRRRDGLRRAGPGRHRQAQGRDLRARVPAARGRGRLPAPGPDLRPERPRRGHGDRGARRVRQELHRRAAADQGALPRRPHERRDLEPVVLVPRQRRRPRGDARGVPLPRDPGRARHGHRQRRATGGLRGHSPRPAGARRGRDLQPTARLRPSASSPSRRPSAARGRSGSSTPPGATRPSRSASSTPSSTGSSTTSRRTPRRRGRSCRGRST